MKILFYQRTDVIESSGGTERVMCNLSSELAERGYEVTLMTNENKNGMPFFHLSDKVKFVNIGKTKFKGFKRFIFEIIKSTPLLKAFSFFDNHKYTSDIVCSHIKNEKPDIIILANPSDLLELCYSNTYDSPIIQMIHNVPWNIFARKSRVIFRETLRVMRKASVCQVLMPSFVKPMKSYYSGKVVTIPNIVTPPKDGINCQYDNSKEKLVISNIARITRAKNQELLIKAFAKIANKYPKWEINIWGKTDKKYKEKLEKIIRESGLDGRIIFKGTTKDVYGDLAKTDIFAFPSLFEGFGIALCEAMSIGLPCIGLEKAPAVGEIIINNKTGLLAKNDVDDFAEKLEELINDEELRRRLGDSARETIGDYSKEKVIEKWEQLIKETYENS